MHNALCFSLANDLKGFKGQLHVGSNVLFCPGVIFPSLLQLQAGITERDDQKQKEVCALKYRKKDEYDKYKLMELEKEIDEECGICMEINDMLVLPYCNHSLCSKCYKDW